MSAERMRIGTLSEDGGELYLFVRADHQHPWWRQLYENLLSLGPGEFWKRDEEFSLSRCRSGPELQEQLLTLLSQAPEDELGEHRSLRLTLNRIRSNRPASLVFFSRL